MLIPPSPQHLWLKQLVGNWRYETECKMGPDQPTSKMTGTESIRLLGDFWAICESRGKMPDGGDMSAIMTIGFDPAHNKFIGTWIGSMMPTLFIYEGTLTESATPPIASLPLNTTGPSWADPTKLATYQDHIELHSPTRRTLTSRLLNDNGQWQTFMTATYTRVD